MVMDHREHCLGCMILVTLSRYSCVAVPIRVDYAPYWLYCVRKVKLIAKISD